MARPRKLTLQQEAALRRLIERARNRPVPFTWKELQYHTGLSRKTLWRIWRGRPNEDRRVSTHHQPRQSAAGGLYLQDRAGQAGVG